MSKMPITFIAYSRMERNRKILFLLVASTSLGGMRIAYAQDMDPVQGMHHNMKPVGHFSVPNHTGQSSVKRHKPSKTMEGMSGHDDDMEGMYHGGARASDAEEVHVTGMSAVRRAAARLLSVPGGTSVVDSKMVLRQRTSTIGDWLAFQPGVYAPAATGDNDVHLSIRGSGIQAGTGSARVGTLVLLDDLPATRIGGAPMELMEPLGMQYMEIYRGGNGFDLGSTLLGGAINMHTLTGYDAKTYQARVEAGSFGYVKEQLSSGKVVGKSDYYISVTNSYRSGYQQNTKISNFGINFNYGYKFSDSVDTRFFFRYRQSYEGQPNYLTRAQIAENPKQARPGYYNTYTILPGTKYFGDRTRIRIDDKSNLLIGFTYIDAPMNHGLRTLQLPMNVIGANGVVDYTRKDRIWGHKSNTNLGVYTTVDVGYNYYDYRVRSTSAYASYGLPFGASVNRWHRGGSNTIWHLSNETEVYKNLWLTAAGALSYMPRSTTTTYPVQSHFSVNPLYFAPRGGFRYQATPDIRIYGNVTRSVQSATDNDFLSGSQYQSGPATGLTEGYQRLKPQTATTFEIGSEGTFKGQHWSVSYYHSAVRNELLSVMTATSALYNTAVLSNASPTTHQGVEVGLNHKIYQWDGNSIYLMHAYTFQDFHYNHDQNFGHNRLPGIPQHLYQAQFHADFKNGFYSSFDVEAASSVYATYDNKAKAAPYHIYNLTFGYLWPKESRRIYFQLHNLANKHYASAVIPVYRATNGDAAAEMPGDGFGVFSGIDLGFN